MAWTYLSLRTAIQLHAGLGDSGDDTTQVNTYLNAAGRDVCSEFDWPELHVEAYVNTPAPYSTGTSAITQDAATVTGTGTTFPSFTANTRKFALDYGSPWYYATRNSATSLTLARNYVETTETAASYVIFSDVLDLASDVQQLDTEAGFRLHTTKPNGAIDWVPLSRFDSANYIDGVTGRPQAWTLLPDFTAGTRRVRIWPIPDAVYALCYRYRKGWTDLSADGDEPVLSEARRDLILWKALEPCAILAGNPALAEWAAGKYERALRKAIANEKPIAPAATRFRAWDEGSPRSGIIWMPTS